MDLVALTDLRLATSYPLPGLPILTEGPAQASLHLAPVPPLSPTARYLGDLASFSEAGQANRCHGDAASLWFEIAELGRFWVSAGEAILAERHPAAQPAAFHSFITQVCLPTLMQQRGCLVLHAGGLRLGNAALLLLGDSGAGKSSLTAALALAGHPLISDDVCLLQRDPWRAFATMPRLRLLPEAFTQLGAVTPAGHEGQLFYGKHLVTAPEVPAGESTPLAAIASLAWGETLSITPLTGAARLQALLNAAAWIGHERTPASAQQHFAACAALAKSVPFWRITRPRDWRVMPDLLALIQQRVSALASAVMPDAETKNKDRENAAAPVALRLLDK